MTTRDQFKHFYTLAVRWGDMDALGHINNVQLLRYLESGRVAYCAEVLQLNFGPAMAAGWIVAKLSASFHSQVHYPSVIDVATRCRRIGNSSCEIEAALFAHEQNDVILSSSAIMVWFDYTRQVSAPIPTELREVVRQYENVLPEEGKSRD